MDSLGYFGKWFPTEHKKYTAIIAMMYVGVVTTVLLGYGGPWMS